MTFDLRAAQPQDCADILEIFNAAVRSGTANTEPQEKNLDDMRAWLADHDSRYVVVVAESGGKIAGYASLNKYFPQRVAYRGTADISYYVHPEWHGRGVGSALMKHLLELAPRNGFHKIVVRTFPTNIASRRLLQKFGFSEVGIYRCDAIMGDRLADVLAAEKLLLTAQ